MVINNRVEPVFTFLWSIFLISLYASHILHHLIFLDKRRYEKKLLRGKRNKRRCGETVNKLKFGGEVQPHLHLCCPYLQ